MGWDGDRDSGRDGDMGDQNEQTDKDGRSHLTGLISRPER